MFKIRHAAVAVVTVGALALAGCSADQGSGGGDASVLRLGHFQQATSFAAEDSNWGNESIHMQAVYDTLLRSAPDGTLIPGLATEWAYDDSQTVLTLQLRDDVDFSDGEHFDAEAAAQNLLRFRDGASPNKAYGASIADAVATGEYTLQITLTGKDPAFTKYLAWNLGLVESPAAFGNEDLQTNPVGSGPYTLNLDETVTGSVYVYDKAEDYWDPELQHYDEIEIRIYSDPTAMTNALQAGELDAANLINNDSLEQIEGAGYTAHGWELSWYGLIMIDRTGALNPALADVRVRQAIAYAFDKEGMLEAAGGGYGTTTGQVFPERSAAFDAELDGTYDYDPEKSKALLAEAGYADGLTIDMPSTSFFPQSVLALVGQQLKDVGITVNWTDTGNNFISDMLTPKFGVTLMQLQQDIDWALINFQISENATFNPGRTQSDELDALIDTVQNGTQEEADAAVRSINEYIVDEAWFAPWYRTQSTFVTDAETDVDVQVENSIPWIWDISPKS